MQEPIGCLKGGVHAGMNGMFDGGMFMKEPMGFLGGGVPAVIGLPTCRNAPNCACRFMYTVQVIPPKYHQR
jgi:hypothetical protein